MLSVGRGVRVYLAREDSIQPARLTTFGPSRHTAIELCCRCKRSGTDSVAVGFGACFLRDDVYGQTWFQPGIIAEAIMASQRTSRCPTTGIIAEVT